jgi:hypothetical protein
LAAASSTRWVNKREVRSAEGQVESHAHEQHPNCHEALVVRASAWYYVAYKNAASAASAASVGPIPGPLGEARGGRGFTSSVRGGGRGGRSQSGRDIDNNSVKGDALVLEGDLSQSGGPKRPTTNLPPVLLSFGWLKHSLLLKTIPSLGADAISDVITDRVQDPKDASTGSSQLLHDHSSSTMSTKHEANQAREDLLLENRSSQSLNESLKLVGPSWADLVEEEMSATGGPLFSGMSVVECLSEQILDGSNNESQGRFELAEASLAMGRKKKKKRAHSTRGGHAWR